MLSVLLILAALPRQAPLPPQAPPLRVVRVVHAPAALHHAPPAVMHWSAPVIRYAQPTHYAPLPSYAPAFRSSGGC